MNVLTSLSSLYDESHSPSHVYYDITMVNNDVTDRTVDPAIRFTEVRNMPYLHDPFKYYLSVVRFTLETADSLPLFVPQIQTSPNTDPNLTVYAVTLSYTYNSIVYNSQVYVEYVPSLSLTPPTMPFSRQDASNKYYWIQNYQKFVMMVNQAYSDALVALSVLVVAAGGALPTTLPPFLTYDTQSSLFTLNASSVVNTYTGVNPIQIFMNSPLYQLFTSLDAIYNGINIPSGKNYQLSVYDTQNNTVNANFQMRQNYISTPTWCPVKGITFESGTLPISNDLIAKTVVFNDSAAVSQGSENQTAAILTDFTVGLVTGSEYLPVLQYAPSVYRLIDLYGNTALSQIDMSVFWVDKFNTRYPLTLSSNRSCQLKIMFRKKTLGL